MKIALLTIWHCYNFGAELQAYATIKILQQLGHDVEMINIRLSDCAHPNINGRLGNFISKFGPSHRSFRKFWNKHIPTTKRYKTFKALQSSPPKADIYIVGSDQVWNPEITGDFTSLYFLDFGPDNIKRISYASSFGVENWKQPQLKEHVLNLLKRFKTVTCREESGVKLLETNFGIKAHNVVDPTLLLQDYSNLTGKTTQRSTLVYYPLHHDPELKKNSIEIASQLGLQPINNNENKTIIGSVVWDRVSIPLWIKNIAEAEFVITRSFHGMIFSIIHKRQFAVVSSKNGRNTRLTNLLHRLGLDARFFKSFEELKSAKPWKQPIDYNVVTPKLNLIREESLNILKDSIAL